MEGTTAHRVAELCLKQDIGPWRYVGKRILGVKVTREMAEAIQMYCELIDEDLSKAHPKSKLHVEVKLDTSFLHEETGGTSDSVIEQPDIVTVYDFKFGKGHDVKVQGNTQGMAYLINWLRPKMSFGFVVCQPRLRSGKIKRWEPVKPTDLKRFIKRAKWAIKNSESKNPIFKEGPWCWFCPANQNNTCPLKEVKRLQKAIKEFEEFYDN